MGRQDKLGISAYWAIQVATMLKKKQSSDLNNYDTVNQK